MSKEFLAYHKTNEMGDPERFTAKTRRKSAAQESYGHRVWLISGEGTPRRYFLEQTFIVDEMIENPGTDLLKYSVRGTKGTIRRVEVGNEPWFGELNITTGNFRRGFSEIKSVAVRHGLEKILEGQTQLSSARKQTCP